MLRTELLEFAKAREHVLIVGRVVEVRRHSAEHTDVMLKTCSVRKVEQGKPVSSHPEVHTDHLWLRMPSEHLQKEEPPRECPTDLRHLYRREGIQMLRKVRVLGRAGFYTQADGSLGIGVPEVIPLVSEHRMLATVCSAQDCFLSHPWRQECLQTLREVVAKVRRHLRNDWVLLDTPADEVERKLARLVERCERNHQAELKARLGTQTLLPTLPGFNPLLDGAANRGSEQSAVERLVDLGRTGEAWRRRYGRLR